MLSWLEKKEKWKVLAGDSLGVMGEKWGCQYLEKKGYKILETNFKNPQGRRLGEIDIIVEKDRKIVFVEVKTKHILGLAYGLPEDNINKKKLHKLQKIAAYYLKQKKWLDREYGFDGLAITYDETNRTAKIRHLPDIFY